MINLIKKFNWSAAVLISVWCIITLLRVLHHSPWYDEAHAWLISQELSLTEIIRLMKIEGHTFLWYLCMMPFAKTNFMYPYSMLLLNWFFCFIAMLILWLKAPFNNWIKFLISFSFPFLALYPVIARCYSIGIMFLFGLAAMEKSKLRHPNWYSLLLILCANTSVMAAVGATVFGFIFLYEMIKNKISIGVPLVTMILGAVVVLMQLPLNLSKNVLVTMIDRPLTIYFFSSTFLDNSLLVNLSIIVLVCIFVILFCIKNKKFPLFLILSYLLLFCVFYKYSGAMWHHFFFYVYFVIFVWLLYENDYNQKLQWKWLLLSVLATISIFFIFWTPKTEDIKKVWNCADLEVSKLILEDENISNSNIFVFGLYQSIFPLYFRGHNINVINYCSGNTNQWDIRPYYYSTVCQFDGKDNSIVVLKDEYISKFYTENSYLLTSDKIQSPDGSFSGGLKNYKFVLYKNYGQNVLWKVEKIK